jgi:general secretion pathway protein G
MRRETGNLRCGAARRRSRGFTLVEILIVVIILGILASIVIPQFATASEDARRNSLQSLLQTLRAQLELYRLQHVDENPPGLDTVGLRDGSIAWAEMLVKTDKDHTTNPNGLLGPYLQTMPVNSISINAPANSVDVFVVIADVTPGGPSGAGSAGWVFNRLNGKLWATSKTGAFVYDESDALAPTNSQ